MCSTYSTILIINVTYPDFKGRLKRKTTNFYYGLSTWSLLDVMHVKIITKFLLRVLAAHQVLRFSPFHSGQLHLVTVEKGHGQNMSSL